MLFLLCWAIGLDFYVIVHHQHTWSVLVVFTLVFLAFWTPHCCNGYTPDYYYSISSHTSMTEETYMNCRDAGFMMAGVMYLLTYVFPAVAWFRSDGVRPNLWAVEAMYAGNVCFGCAYALFYFIFIQTQREM
jgi:hypothetical protein